MKLMIITSAYSQCITKFFQRNKELHKKTYQEQANAYHYFGFGWADFWSNALKGKGYDVFEVTLNAESIQRAWVKEHLPQKYKSLSIYDIVFEQVKWFKPEIVWFDCFAEELLDKIKSEVPSIKLVLGWVGSAIPKSNIWGKIDLVLSCAPESVDRLQKMGFYAGYLNHGFEPRINERLINRQKLYEISFIGLIIRDKQFHLGREKILEGLASDVDVDVNIYSPNAEINLLNNLELMIKRLAYDSVYLSKRLGMSEGILNKIPKIRSVLKWEGKPVSHKNDVLKPFLKPSVYGLDMFQVIKDSKVMLNVHADSSPLYASNMRLYETTGVGTCLLTDWKSNLCSLFEPDKEVVTYKTIDECIENAKWLSEHPGEREAIAKAGQKRTLKDHTFTQRAIELDTIIKNELKRH